MSLEPFARSRSSLSIVYGVFVSLTLTISYRVQNVRHSYLIREDVTANSNDAQV